jgi:proline iminopeptidase
VRDLYPPIEPYDRGLLDVGDDNRVYWETCGETLDEFARR